MMKISKNIFKTTASIFLIALAIACSKDDDSMPEENGQNLQAQANFESNYFTATGGDFVNRGLPEINSNELEIVDLNGNPSVIPGGSNLIGITPSGNANEVIVGVEGQKGYFTVPFDAGRNTQGRGTSTNPAEVALQLLIGQEASSDFTIAFALSDGQGNFGAYQYFDVALINAGTGLLQVSLSWNQPNDVDLHLIEPDGEEIYYGDSVSSNGGELDVDSNAACSIDNINNENIFYEDATELENGEYEVLVDLWSNCNIEENTNYIVTVYYDGALIATTEGTNPFNGTFQPEDESGNSNPTSVIKFTIDDASGRIIGGNKKTPNVVLSPEKL